MNMQAHARFLEALIHKAPNFKGKTRICTLIGRSIEGQLIKSAYGPVIECHLNDATNKAAVFGWYGRKVYDVVAALRTGEAFIDIGANSGLFSIIAAQAVGKSGCVYAFEPQPTMFRTLKNNLKSNGVDHVVSVNAAVASDSGQISMTRLDANHTGVARIDPKSSGSIRAINIDRDMPELGENIGDRKLAIKIDVEGAELEVLGAIGSLLSKANTVVIEIDEKNLAKFGASPTELYSVMAGHGLTPRQKIRAGHYDEVFDRRSESESH